MWTRDQRVGSSVGQIPKQTRRVFWPERAAGAPVGPAHTLVVARHRLAPEEVKYFLSNLVIDGPTVTLDWLLWVTFSRWPIGKPRCDGSRGLGSIFTNSSLVYRIIDEQISLWY